MGAELLAGTPLLDRVEESSGLFCVHLAASRALQHKADLYYEYMEVQRGGTPMWGSHGGGGAAAALPHHAAAPQKAASGFCLCWEGGEDWGGRIPWDPRPRPSVRRSSECCSCLFPGPPAPPAWLHKSLWGGHLCGVAAPALIHPPPPPFIPSPSSNPQRFGFPRGGLSSAPRRLLFFFCLLAILGLKAAFWRGELLGCHAPSAPPPNHQSRGVELNPFPTPRRESC